jgi:hypothetical protein
MQSYATTASSAPHFYMKCRVSKPRWRQSLPPVYWKFANSHIIVPLVVVVYV